MMPGDAALIYIFDSLCGWCYGFSDAVLAFRERHPELPFTAVSGGLFTGQMRGPIGDFSFIPEANAEITSLTGAVFGEPYEALLREGTLALDSDVAAAGYAALRALAPDKAIELAVAVQRAFFLVGRSLNDPQTYADIARTHGLQGLDLDALAAHMSDPASAPAVHEDYARAKELSDRAFPTLLLDIGGQKHILTVGVTSLDALEAKLDELAKS